MDLFSSMTVFVRVVEQGSFAAAAKDLGLSATMVGKHLGSLEHRLGARLLHRTTRRQSLSEEGRLYFERCRQLIAGVKEAETSVIALRKAPRGLLRVVSPVTFGEQRLAPALAAFLRQYGEITVELTLNDRGLDLVSGNHDVAIRIGKLPDSGLLACPLQPYRMLVCAAPEYVALHGEPREPEDLKHHNCLVYTFADHRNTWRLVGPKGDHRVRVQGNFSTSHGPALRAAAIAGMGVIMQPEALLADDVAAGRLVVLLANYAPPARPVHLVYLAERRISPKLRAFVDFMLKRFGKNLPTPATRR